MSWVHAAAHVLYCSSSAHFCPQALFHKVDMLLTVSIKGNLCQLKLWDKFVFNETRIYYNKLEHYIIFKLVLQYNLVLVNTSKQEFNINKFIPVSSSSWQMSRVWRSKMNKLLMTMTIIIFAHSLLNGKLAKNHVI